MNPHAPQGRSTLLEPFHSTPRPSIHLQNAPILSNPLPQPEVTFPSIPNAFSHPQSPPSPTTSTTPKSWGSPLTLDLTNDFDPFTKLNLNSSLDRANSKTYNPWEMISRLQTIAKTVPFHPKLYKRSPVNRSPGILTETITASLLQGNHRMNSARLQV